MSEVELIKRKLLYAVGKENIPQDTACAMVEKTINDIANGNTRALCDLTLLIDIPKNAEGFTPTTLSGKFQLYQRTFDVNNLSEDDVSLFAKSIIVAIRIAERRSKADRRSDIGYSTYSLPKSGGRNIRGTKSFS